jgi:hypothetical protein
MTHVGFVLSSWIVGLGSLSAYTLWVLVRGRRLSNQVPAERRRWS